MKPYKLLRSTPALTRNVVLRIAKTPRRVPLRLLRNGTPIPRNVSFVLPEPE